MNGDLEYSSQGIDAFDAYRYKRSRRVEAQAAESRAWQILSLGEQLTREPDDGAAFDEAYQLDIRELNAPQVPAAKRRSADEEVSKWRRTPPAAQSDLNSTDLWSRASDGEAEAAEDLIILGMRDEQLLVRVASAAAQIAVELATGVTSDNLPHGLVRDLTDGAGGSDEAVRAIAGGVLEAIGEKPARGRSVSELGNRPSANVPAEVSIGVHGTFSPYSKSPVSVPHSFYGYLLDRHTDSLHRENRSAYGWTGKFYEPARAAAAAELCEWNERMNGGRALDTIYAHSHGGNVVLNAIQAGLRVRHLVLLSAPPRHRTPAEWDQIDSRVQSITSLKSRADYVLLGDYLAQRIRRLAKGQPVGRPFDFRRPKDIFEPTETTWFSHSRWLSPDVWQIKGISDLLEQRDLIARN